MLPILLKQMVCVASAIGFILSTLQQARLRACLNPDTADFEPSSQPSTRKRPMVATSSKGGDATPRPVAQTPRGAGAAATPATAPRGSDDGALPLRIPFQAEKKGKSPQGRADGRRGKGRGVVNAATAASALRSTQDNTVLLADVLRRLAVQGTVQPVGGKRHRTALDRGSSCCGVWRAWDA